MWDKHGQCSGWGCVAVSEATLRDQTCECVLALMYVVVIKGMACVLRFSKGRLADSVYLFIAENIAFKSL